jgi:hypothetical protein
MKFKKDEIIFIFGAGISADADIPVSSKMLESVENLVNTDNDWRKYKDLYYLIKSGVGYSYGIQGKKAIFNIEVLVNILNEIEKKETHPLYPFIGSWNIKFNETVGNNFELIKKFKKDIINKLKTWMQPRDLRKSNYLRKLKDLQFQINFPIRVFTLNYDLLLETNLKEVGLNIERGFDENKKWNYKRFAENVEEPNVYLYKLHGSIDWEQDEKTQNVRCLDSIPDEPALIFGTQYKVQYVDPYLFMISEFRYYCLRAKLIVCLGYSFSDEHINGILKQSFANNESIKIYCLAYKEKEEKILELFQNKYRLSIITDKTAKEFFENDLRLELFESLFEQKDEII